MNVLMMSTHLNAGGITSYLLTLTKGLVGLNHCVHVATAGGALAKDFELAGARLIELNIKTKSELSPKLYFALKPLRQYIEKHQISVLHAHTRISQVLASRLSSQAARPYVSTCHGYFRVRLSRKWAPCWGDAVIAISKAVKDHLANDFRHDPRKIHLIPSGVDLKEFNPDSRLNTEDQRARFGINGGLVIGMIARLSDVKGPDILVEAMLHVLKRNKHAMLLLVGEGKMEPELRAQIKRLGLSGSIRMFSAVNRTREMLSLMDIFVMPSRQEGLGLSIMEAQSMGLPVIASRVGGIPSLIEHGQTGMLVEPENPRALADAIIELSENHQKQKQLGAAARQMITQKHSMEQMAQKTAEVYQRAISERS